jgi:GxxExxY protein
LKDNSVCQSCMKEFGWMPACDWTCSFAQMVIVELKAVERMSPLYEAQLLTYLKLGGKRLGLLINFNALMLKDGFKR